MSCHLIAPRIPRISTQIIKMMTISRILSAVLLPLSSLVLSACASLGPGQPSSAGPDVQLQQAINTLGTMLGGAAPVSAAANHRTITSAASGTEGMLMIINGAKVIVDGPPPTDPRWRGKLIEDTPLYKLFERNPLSSPGNNWPRVSIHIDDYSDSLANASTDYVSVPHPPECIKFTAVIWASKKKSQKVEGVVLCNVHLKSTDRYLSLGALRTYHSSFGPAYTDTSGQVRSAGPLIPKRLVPIATSEDNRFYQNGGYLISSLLIKTGFQGPIDGDSRLWFINFTNATY